MGEADRFDRDASGYDGYERDGGRSDDGEAVDRILHSLDRLGARIRTLAPADDRRPPRPAPRAAEPDDLQRAIDQISRKRDALESARLDRDDDGGVAEIGARVRALSQGMASDRRPRAPAPHANDALTAEIGDLRLQVERLIADSPGRSLEHAFDALVERLDGIRLSVDNPRLVGDLVQRLADIRRLITTLPSGEQVGVITDRLDLLASRLDQGLGDQRVVSDFGRSLSDLAAAVAELDKREVISAIERRLDDVGESIRAIERGLGGLSRWQESVDRQTSALSQLAQRSEQLPRFAHELERQSASLDRLARSTEGLPRIAEDIDTLRSTLDRPGAALDAAAIRALDERFAELGRSLEQQLRPAASGIPADLLAALARIEAKLSEPTPTGRMTEIEDQIAVLTRSVAGIDFATTKDVAAIEGAIGRLRDDVLLATGRPDSGLASDIRTLVDRLDRLDPPSIGSAAFDRLEARMSDIVARLEKRPNETAALADALERLEATMASSLSVDAISDRMAAAVERRGDDGAPARLTALETNINRLGEDLRANAERDRGLLVAIGETIEKMVRHDLGANTTGPAAAVARPADAVAPPSGSDAAAWEEIGQVLTNSFTRPSDPIDDADDLPRIFGRKSTRRARVEPTIGQPGDSEASPAVVHLPPDFDANKPLAPGSGKPHLPKAAKAAPAADRKPATPATPDAPRAPSKADFIAAARRAAQTAGTPPTADDRKGAAASGKAAGQGAARAVSFNLRKVAMVAAAVLIALGIAKIANDTLHRFLAPTNTPSVAAQTTAPASSVSDASGATPPADTVAPPATNLVPPADTPAPSTESSVTGTAPQSETLPPPQAPSSEDNALDTRSVTPAPGFSKAPPPLPTDSFAPMAPAMPAASTGALSEATTPPAVDPTQAVGSLALPPLPDAIGPTALREAATAGNPLAAFEVGSRYADGRGVPQDLGSAIAWYRRAAEGGLAPAQYRLGSLLEKGQGVARDAKAAAAWYTKAAAQGNSKAMHNLAVLNAEGSIGAPNYLLAAKWFQGAAEHGVRDSQFNLGILYARGLGVPRDLASSYKWFAIAAAAGDTDSAKKRDDIAQVLSKEDLARARLAVETWVAKPIDPAAEDVPPADPAWALAPEHTASIDETRVIARTQAILSSLGFDAGPPDGKMGKRTRDAIAAFQSSNGLASTGQIDAALIRALGAQTI